MDVKRVESEGKLCRELALNIPASQSYQTSVPSYDPQLHPDIKYNFIKIHFLKQFKFLTSLTRVTLHSDPLKT